MRGCGEVPGDQFNNHHLSCGSETVVLGVVDGGLTQP